MGVRLKGGPSERGGYYRTQFLARPALKVVAERWGAPVKKIGILSGHSSSDEGSLGKAMNLELIFALGQR